MDNLVLREYRDEDKERVVDLLRHLWTDRDDIQRMQLFEWKYEHAPYLSRLKFVATLNDSIVGFRGYTANPAQLISSEIIYIACLADAVTHPQTRGMGIFKRLTSYSLKKLNEYNNLKVILALSSNKLSTPGYLKLGWLSLGDKNPMFRLSLPAILRKMLIGEISSVKKKYNDGSNIFKFTSKLDFNIADIVMLATERMKTGRITTYRTEEWYSWRLSNPMKNYFFSSCWQGDKLTGLLLLNKSEKYWTLVDCLYEDDSILDRLLGLTLKVYRPSVLMIWTASRSDQFIKIFSKRGFKPHRYIIRKTLEPILVRPNMPDPKEQDWFLGPYDIRKPETWDISLYDSDAT